MHRPPALDATLPALPKPLERELEQTAIRGRIDEARGYLQKTLALFDEGKLAASITAARKAKDAAPRSPSVREVLGLIYHAKGYYKDALAEFRAFKRMSGSGMQDPIIAECYRRLGKPDEALDVLSAISRESLDAAGWADAQIARANAHADKGNLDAAIGLLRAVAEWPSQPAAHNLRVWYALADTLERAAQREEARKLFARIAVYMPGFRDALDRAR